MRHIAMHFKCHHLDVNAVPNESPYLYDFSQLVARQHRVCVENGKFFVILALSLRMSICTERSDLQPSSCFRACGLLLTSLRAEA